MNTNKFNTHKAFKFNDEINFSDGSIVSKRVLEQKTGNVSLFAFDKGQQLSEHTAPFDAMLQVVEGKAEIIIGGVSNHLQAGETIIMPANISHSVKASERFKMVLTMIKA